MKINQGFMVADTVFGPSNPKARPISVY